MVGRSCLCARDFKCGRNQVPRCRLAQPLAGGTPRDLALRLDQWHGVELKALTEHPQQMRDPLEEASVTRRRARCG